VVDLTKLAIPDVVDLTKAMMLEVTVPNMPDIEQLFEMMSQRFFGKGFINPNEVHITPPFPNPFSLTNQPSSPTNQPTQPPENQLVLQTQPTPNQSPEPLSEYSEHLPEFAQTPKLSSSKRPAKSQHNLSDSDKDSTKKKSDNNKKKKRR
jgi:hypothetical protein